MSEGWVIEYCSTDWDYPSWEQLHDNRPGHYDEVLVFSSEAHAREWLNADLDANLAARKALWDEKYAKWLPHKERYEKRVAVLKAAGLWEFDDESFSPLVSWASPGPEPIRDDGTCEYRIVQLLSAAAPKEG